MSGPYRSIPLSPFPVDRKHIFEGGLRRQGREASGFHSEAIVQDTARVTGPRVEFDPRSHAYEAPVQVRKSTAATWRDKPEPSTFFPMDFSQAKVESHLKRAQTLASQTGSATVMVPFRRFATTAEESVGLMKTRVELTPDHQIRGFPMKW